MLEIPKSENIVFDCKSLKPLLIGNDNDWPDRYLFFQFNRGMVPRLYQNCAVRNQQYKLVSEYQNSSERGTHTSDLESRFELYDMNADPGETRNLADILPEVVQKMQSKYENWYEEMKSDSNFEPGLIHIGSKKVNPVRLCRYQDMSYIDDKPVGWPVKILTEGQYQISINNCGYNHSNKLCVQFTGIVKNKRLFTGENSAVFSLPKGNGILNIWFEYGEKDNYVFTANHTIGDVDLELMP